MGAAEYDLGLGKPVLFAGAPEFRGRTAALREEWTFNFGRSDEAGAREIARIADGRTCASALGTLC